MTPSTSTPVKMSLPLSPQLETDDPLMEQVGYDNYFLILHCFLKLMSSYLWNILGYACFKRLGKFHVQMLSQMVIHHTSVMFGVAVRGWLVRDWKFFCSYAWSCNAYFHTDYCKFYPAKTTYFAATDRYCWLIICYKNLASCCPTGGMIPLLTYNFVALSWTTSFFHISDTWFLDWYQPAWFSWDAFLYERCCKFINLN